MIDLTKLRGAGLRLTHDDVRQACGAATTAKEMTCPCCGHNHLQLFGDNDFKRMNDCETGVVAAEIRRRLNIDETPQVRKTEGKAPEGPLEGKLLLVEYAMAKHLPMHLLTEHFGASEGVHPYYDKVEGICFPYFNEKGEAVTQQWRWGMSGKQRRFLQGKPTYLYGGRFFRTLEQMAKDGKHRRDILIVEGESNTHTLALHGFPVLGLPGVRSWQTEWSDLKCLSAASRLYVFLDMEPDGTPEDTAVLGARAIAESFPPGKVFAVKLPFKDVSEMWLWHMTDPLGGGADEFRADLQDAILSAQPIIPKREEREGLPPDLGDVVLNACPVLKDFVAMTLPVTETDINNLICDFLACAGAAIGLKAYRHNLADRHTPATYHLLIGDTAIGKGTCFSCTSLLFESAVPGWRQMVRHSARSQQSLYRMLHEVSADVIKDDEGNESSNPLCNGGHLMLRLPEISALFKAMRAEWSTMSQGLREAYDGGPLSNERSDTQKSIRVNDPYALAVLGDVTPWELSEVIAGVDFANGIANRFIWCVSHRTKTIPHPKPAPDYSELAKRLKRVIPTDPLPELSFSKPAEAAWETWVYTLPLEDAGRLGSACGRMRANGLRLAVLFAVLDESRWNSLDEQPTIEPRHVQAAAVIMDRHRATVQWFLDRPVTVPDGLPEVKKPKRWRQIEKTKDYVDKHGEITKFEHKRMFSNLTAEQRQEIAQAAGLSYEEGRDEKGNKVGVWR
jgi:hypothetical protein